MTQDTPSRECRRVNDTVQWIQGQGVQPQFSLQHLTRHRVLRAMSHRSLLGAATATLSLPFHLQRYVLLQDH